MNHTIPIKNNMRVLTVLILTVFIFVSVIVCAADTKTNFLGKWSLNSDKTLVQGQRTSAQGELDIYQEENSITIKRISPGRHQGQVVTTEELTLDGEIKDSVVSGKPTKSAVSWSPDGKKMTISYLILFAKNDVRTTIEIWALSEDGKSLSINYSSKSAKGARSANYVYDRK